MKKHGFKLKVAAVAAVCLLATAAVAAMIYTIQYRSTYEDIKKDLSRELDTLQDHYFRSIPMKESTEAYNNKIYQSFTELIVHILTREEAEPLSDVIDSHAYLFPKMWFPPNAKRISIVGEFGCAGVFLKGHFHDYRGPTKANLESAEDGAWRERIRKRYEELSRPLVKMAHDGLSGSVYTEAADQFFETCGMMTFDREIVKFDFDFLRALHKEILDAAREGAEGR